MVSNNLLGILGHFTTFLRSITNELDRIPNGRILANQNSKKANKSVHSQTKKGLLSLLLSENTQKYFCNQTNK